jgi:hypothetical protein
MSFNFNIRVNSIFGNKNKTKKGLTPQEEYWLDRILRNHSKQIFVLLLLFFGIIIASVVFSIAYGDRLENEVDFSVVRIKP